MGVVILLWPLFSAAFYSVWRTVGDKTTTPKVLYLQSIQGFGQVAVPAQWSIIRDGSHAAYMDQGGNLRAILCILPPRQFEKRIEWTNSAPIEIMAKKGKEDLFADAVQVCRYKWGKKRGLGVLGAYEQEGFAVELFLMDGRRDDKYVVEEMVSHIKLTEGSDSEHAAEK